MPKKQGLPQNDIISMSNYIDELLLAANLSSHMGNKGQAKMRREISVEEMVRRMTQIYDAFAAKRLR